jgi:hypothetical protein
MFIEKLLSKFLQGKRTPKDIFLLSLLALLLLWQPSYLRQQLNLYEWGLYLPGIDAVSQGQVPFRDFFHLRGPFELYVPTLFMKIFGFRADVLAAYFYLGTVLTILVAVLIAYELVQQRVLLYSFVLIVVARTFPRVAFTFWGGMRYAWGLLAVWCLIRFLKSSRLGWLLAAGCLAATAALTSIEIGVIVWVAFMVLMALSRGHRRWSWVFLSGFLVVTLPYGIYLLGQNAFMQYVQAQWIVVTHMQKTFVQLDRVPDTVPKFLHAIFFPQDKSFYQMTPMCCYASFFSLYFWRVFNKKVTALEQAALVVAVYGLILFLTGFRKIEFVEYEMSLQPDKIVLFYLLGQFIVWAGQRLARFKWVGAVLLAAVLISSVTYTIGRFKTRYYKSSWVCQLIGREEKKQALINGSPVTLIHLPRIKHMTIPVWQAKDLEQLKAFVDEHVPAHEAVWMYPDLGSLYFILDRPWVGRFPMVTLSWMDEGWFADYAAALQQHPPMYAIVTKEKLLLYFYRTDFLVPANHIKHERMMQFLYNHYVIEGQSPSYFIYRRIH